MEDSELYFTKMHATGNDYIYIDCFHKNIKVEEIKPYIKYMCDRNFGIGGDGVIFITPSEVALAKMLMYNKDGSEASICGNGIRCVAKYLYENKLTQKKEFTIETKSGVKEVILHNHLGEIETISVNMGYPKFNPKLVPVITEKSLFVNENISIEDQIYPTTCLSMGNPHAVVFTKYIYSLKLDKLGPDFECHYLFPEKTNVEFVEKMGDQKIQMRIWERGVGETLSCGSGACASVAVGIETEEFKKNELVQVIQKGGTLQVEYKEQEGMILTGGAEKVYEGKVLLKRK